MDAKERMRPKFISEIKRDIEEVDMLDQNRNNVCDCRRKKKPKGLENGQQEKVHEIREEDGAYKVCCSLLDLLCFQKKFKRIRVLEKEKVKS